eukprot:2663514-Rhodomonas_salina.2
MVHVQHIPQPHPDVLLRAQPSKDRPEVEVPVVSHVDFKPLARAAPVIADAPPHAEHALAAQSAMLAPRIERKEKKVRVYL